MQKTIFLFLFLFTNSIFAQFPGERTKEKFLGPDKFEYKTGDVVQLSHALNGEEYRSIYIYKHKSVLENVSDGLSVVNATLGNEENTTQKSKITHLPKSFLDFKGGIKYFKIADINGVKTVFAILKISNSEKRIAVSMQEAILNGEMISKNENYKPEKIIENEAIENLSIKSFSKDFSVKLLSCIGDKNQQTVKVEFLIKHNKVHKKICFNYGDDDAKAYDMSGNEYNANEVYVGSNNTGGIFGQYVCNKIPTNIAVKSSINFNKVLSSVDKISFLTIKVGYKDYDDNNSYKYGNIELKNVDIDWEN